MRTPSSPEEKRTWRCLDEFQLAGFLDGVLSGWGRRRAERHLTRCERCRRELSLLLHSQRTPQQPPPPEWLAKVRDLGEKNAPAHRSWQWAIAGAGLACSLALGAWFVTRTHQAPANLAKNAAPAMLPSATPPENEDSQVRNLSKSVAEPMVIAPAAGATVAPNLEIQWRPVPSSISYDLVIVNAEGDTVWRARTTKESLQVPATAPLNRGAEYFIMISANLSSGKTVRAKAVPFWIGKQ